MEQQFKTFGIVLGHTDSGEYDRRIDCFSETYGRIELLAKAVRKITSKLRGGLMFGYLSWLEFVEGKHGFIVTEAMAVKRYESINKNLAKFKTAYSLANFIGRFVPEQEKDELLWKMLLNTWETLGGRSFSDNGLRLFQPYSKWRLLFHFGYAPELHCCFHCHTKLRPELAYFFDVYGGGVICTSCRKNDDGEPISIEAIKLVRLFMEEKDNLLWRLKHHGLPLDEIENLCEKYAQALSGSFPKKYVAAS